MVLKTWLKFQPQQHEPEIPGGGTTPEAIHRVEKRVARQPLMLFENQGGLFLLIFLYSLEMKFEKIFIKVSLKKETWSFEGLQDNFRKQSNNFYYCINGAIMSSEIHTFCKIFDFWPIRK